MKKLCSALIAVVVSCWFTIAVNANENAILQQMLEPVYKIYSGSTPRCSSVIVKSEKDQFDRFNTFILTANHCVGVKDLNIRVQSLDEGYNVYKETVYYLKKIKTYAQGDVAVLKVIDTSRQFPVATIAPEGYLTRAGREVWVVGYPNMLERTITTGLFTGLGKFPKDPSMIMSRATAPVYGGSSGGPMFIKRDGNYEIIGIVSARHTKSSFLNFFAPLAAVYNVIPE